MHHCHANIDGENQNEQTKSAKHKGTNIESTGDNQQGLKSVTARLDNLESKIEKLVNKEDVTKESKQVSYADIDISPSTLTFLRQLLLR